MQKKIKKIKKTIDFQKKQYTLIISNSNKGKKPCQKNIHLLIKRYLAQERLAFYTRRQLESTTIVNEINNLLAFLYNLKKECGVKR